MKKFRNYENSKFQNRVENTYKLMLENQTLNYVNKKKEKYLNSLSKIYKLEDIINYFNNIKDDSDPDTDLPQIVHAYQTSESIKNNYFLKNRIKKNIKIKNLFSQIEWNNLDDNIKNEYNTTLDKYYNKILDWDWFPLLGLIHDLGKIMILNNFGGLPQWAVVGDTFPLGEKLSSNYVFYEKNYHKNNIDLNTNIYNNNCGFDKVTFSWGHDEFIASIIESNKTKFPQEAIYILRYHSFYSWHTPRNGIRGYTNLANKKDWYMLPLLKAFQKADLYSKTTNIPSIEQIKNSYKKSINKYFLYPDIILI